MRKLKKNRSTPKGIEDVSGYPYLFAELMGHGWTVEELTKLAGGNLLRVFSEVSFVRKLFCVAHSSGIELVCGLCTNLCESLLFGSIPVTFTKL